MHRRSQVAGRRCLLAVTKQIEIVERHVSVHAAEAQAARRPQFLVSRISPLASYNPCSMRDLAAPFLAGGRTRTTIADDADALTSRVDSWSLGFLASGLMPAAYRGRCPDRARSACGLRLTSWAPASRAKHGPRYAFTPRAVPSYIWHPRKAVSSMPELWYTIELALPVLTLRTAYGVRLNG